MENFQGNNDEERKVLKALLARISEKEKYLKEILDEIGWVSLRQGLSFTVAVRRRDKYHAEYLGNQHVLDFVLTNSSDIEVSTKWRVQFSIHCNGVFQIRTYIMDRILRCDSLKLSVPIRVKDPTQRHTVRCSLITVSPNYRVIDLKQIVDLDVTHFFDLNDSLPMSGSSSNKVTPFFNSKRYSLPMLGSSTNKLTVFFDLPSVSLPTKKRRFSSSTTPSRYHAEDMTCSIRLPKGIDDDNLWEIVLRDKGHHIPTGSQSLSIFVGNKHLTISLNAVDRTLKLTSNDIKLRYAAKQGLTTLLTQYRGTVNLDIPNILWRVHSFEIEVMASDMHPVEARNRWREITALLPP